MEQRRQDDIMEQIRNFFNQMVTVSDKDWQRFSSKLTRQQFPKKALLLKPGQTEKYLSFIEQGMVRFYVPKEENDLTFGFAFDHTFISAYDSFLTQTPSTYAVETLAETVLWRLTYTDLQDIYQGTEIGNTIGRLASEDLYLKKAKRELSLLQETPQQRYLNLFTERPHFMRYIPLQYIASYIGITPQALSRIRRRIS
jgi:CRP-like cAMP-binding protein